MPHTDTASGSVHGTPDEVFAALVDPRAREIWLPPHGMTGRIEWFDARPGGGYRMILAYDDATVRGKSGANTDVVEVRFVDLTRPVEVIEEADFVSEDPAYAGTMTMTWHIGATDEGSLVSITATGVPDGISSADHQTAFRSTLANLDRYLRGA